MLTLSSGCGLRSKCSTRAQINSLSMFSLCLARCRARPHTVLNAHVCGLVLLFYSMAIQLVVIAHTFTHSHTHTKPKTPLSEPTHALRPSWCYLPFLLAQPVAIRWARCACLLHAPAAVGWRTPRLISTI